jgi:hypothetical protein
VDAGSSSLAGIYRSDPQPAPLISFGFCLQRCRKWRANRRGRDRFPGVLERIAARKRFLTLPEATCGQFTGTTVEQPSAPAKAVLGDPRTLRLSSRRYHQSDKVTL